MYRIDSTNRSAPIFDGIGPVHTPAHLSKDDLPSTLPSPSARLESSGDVGAMIAALLVESSQTSREIARKTRDVAVAAEDAAHAAKIAHMENAADQRLIGGIAAGGSKFVSGALESGGELGRNAPIKLAGKAIEGGGETGKAITDFAATHDDIEVQQAERALTQAKRNVDDAAEMDRDAKELINRTLGYYAEYMRAKADAVSAALFRA